MKSFNNTKGYTSNYTKEGLSISESVLYKAVENADGVPFHLVFGQKPGEGYYSFVGEGINRLLGITTAEFTESLYLSMIEEVRPLSDDIPADRSDSYEKFLKGELKSYKAEILIRTADGALKWILESSVPVREDETGRVIGASGILFDINECKQANDKMERARIYTEESEHLKTAFLRNISHEIRTPLNAIVGFSALLSDSGVEDPVLNSYIETIINNSNHLLAVISDIINIANIEANIVKISRNEVILNSIIRSLHARFLPEAEDRGIKLESEAGLPDEESIILTDSTILIQIITNLLVNAFKFTNQGEIKFGYRPKDQFLDFYVSDTGIGIPEEHLERVFDRFYQVEHTFTKQHEGTGVGLTICKKYVELLGGEIRLSSIPGIGSNFNFTIPFKKEMMK